MRFESKTLKLIVRATKEKGVYNQFKNKLYNFSKTHNIPNINGIVTISDEKLLIDEFGTPFFLLWKIGMGYFMDYAERFVSDIYMEKIQTEFEKLLKKYNTKEIYFNYINVNFIKKNVPNITYFELSKITENKKVIYKYLMPKNLIIAAFLWEKTKEGYDFWQKIDSEWHDIVMKIYKNSI